MSENETCDICSKTVADNEEGLLCDKCLIWKHRICLGINQKTYQKISKSPDPWFCSDCQKKNKNQSKPNYTINDVMAKLEDMDQKYNSLFQKYQEQIKINEDLKGELRSIQRQLNRNEQRELNNNVILHGIPYKPNEELRRIVEKVGSELQVDLTSHKFKAVRIGRDESKKNPIKVTFESLDSKTRLLKSPRKFNLNTNNLGFTNENNKIFLNHELTKRNLELFKKAQTFKNENNYKFLWINNGAILLRKIENSKIILVSSEDDLKN